MHTHHHHHDHAEPTVTRWYLPARALLAALILLSAVMAACLIMVPAGEAVVVTRFGDPTRILTTPGLAWKLPAPIEGTIPVDLRLRTTSTGLQDVGTKDGLRILVQAYVAWQVPPDPDRILLFLRSVGNAPDEAALQLRSFVGAALHTTASGFLLADLVNTNPQNVHLADFESRLRAQIEASALDIYGLRITQVGLERLSLPEQTLAATVDRMRAERETVAAQRTAEGLRAAAAIRADAERDARVTVAAAKTEAADIAAQAEREAAEIHAASYRTDPQLYLLLRSLDTIGAVVGANTRLILRTDAAPFNVLVQGVPHDLPAAPETVPAPSLPPSLAPSLGPRAQR
jgi:membrane protease subunit HflC